MHLFKKDTLETIYNTRFSDVDVDIINRKMMHKTKGRLDADTRYCDSLQDYVDYIYLDNLENARTLIKEFVRGVNEIGKIEIGTVDFIPFESNDILLTNNRFIVVMN